MPNKKIYRIGDKVKVTNPQVFVRVGYPLTLEKAFDRVAEVYDQQVTNFCREIEVNINPFLVSHETSKLYNEVMQAVASWYMRDQNFGGKERSIYTEFQKQLQNSGPWLITKKRRIKTGTYNSGSYNYDYDGEPDYVPAYLSPEKSHVLLTLEDHTGTRSYPFSPFEIEEIYVKPFEELTNSKN